MILDSPAHRMLALAADAPFESEGAMLFAAAAAVAEQEAPGTALESISADAGRGIAMVVCAGAQLKSGTENRDMLAALAHTIPRAERGRVLSVTESLLAHVDPIWTWDLIEELVGADGTVAATLGLDIAARVALDDGTDWLPGVRMPEPYIRQLAADRIARSAIAGDVRVRTDPRLAGLHDQQAMQGLFASEARSLLVAAAATDPLWAFDVATTMLDNHGPEELREAFRLVAFAGMRAGLSDQVSAMAHKEGFVSEQATWAAVAASAGALDGDALVQLANELTSRIEDELDADRELVGGLPLIEALAHGGEIDLLIELVLRWRVPLPLLVDRLFFAGATIGASALLEHPGLPQLLNQSEDNWVQLYDYQFGWWTAAKAHSGRLSQAVRDALAVVAATPWRPLPGSLADLVGWG